MVEQASHSTDRQEITDFFKYIADYGTVDQNRLGEIIELINKIYASSPTESFTNQAFMLSNAVSAGVITLEPDEKLAESFKIFRDNVLSRLKDDKERIPRKGLTIDDYTSARIQADVNIGRTNLYFDKIFDQVSPDSPIS